MHVVDIACVEHVADVACVEHVIHQTWKKLPEKFWPCRKFLRLFVDLHNQTV